MSVDRNTSTPSPCAAVSDLQKCIDTMIMIQNLGVDEMKSASRADLQIFGLVAGLLTKVAVAQNEDRVLQGLPSSLKLTPAFWQHCLKSVENAVPADSEVVRATLLQQWDVLKGSAESGSNAEVRCSVAHTLKLVLIFTCLTTLAGSLGA